MLKFINLKKITATSLLAFIMTSSLIVVPAASAKNNNAPGQNKKEKACKSNNGIGDNYDIDIILPSKEKLTIRIDPGNKGQMNKFAGYLATAKNISASTFETVIKPQIVDAEMRANNSNANCPSGSSSSAGSDFTANNAIGEAVSVELVLSVDVSWSVDDDEFRLQHQGYINAFKNNDIKTAIKKLPNGLAVNMQFWSTEELVDTGWYKLTNDTEINNFVSKLENVQRYRTSSYGQYNHLTLDGDQKDSKKKWTYMGMGTDIEKAIKEATKLIDENSYNGQALVIDVSGDGISTDTPYNGQGKKNLGYWPNTKNVCGVQLFCPPVKTARDAALSKGITINGLPINGSRENNKDRPDYYADRIDDFYRDFVITGEDSFVEVATSFNNFGNAAKKKILAEIVKAGNLAASAVNDSFTTDEDTSKTGNVLTNDKNPEKKTLAVNKVNGVATNVGQKLTLPSGASLTVNSNGTFTYNPNAQFESLNDGESKLDSFTYSIDDGYGKISSATVSMSIEGVTEYVPPANVAPNAVDDTTTIEKNVAVTIDVLANDTDSDGGTPVIKSISTDNSNGTTEIVDGKILYTPALDSVTTDTFYYTISDGQGGTDTATVTVSIKETFPEEPENIPFAD